MARAKLQRDQLVKLIVGAGQAAPTPPVGPALGSKGVKSMDFCKEFNARTTNYLPGTPIPARILVRPDRTFTFTLRTPTTAMLLLSAAGVLPHKNKLKGAGNVAGPRALAALVTSNNEPIDKIMDARGKFSATREKVGNAGKGTVGSPVSLKHVYEIARIKQRDTSVELRAVAASVVAQAASVGIVIVP